MNLLKDTHNPDTAELQERVKKAIEAEGFQPDQPPGVRAVGFRTMCGWG